MRGLPQGRSGWAVSGSLNGLRILPFEGFSEDYESEPRQREVCYYLRIVSRLLLQLVGREVRSQHDRVSADQWPCECALRLLPPQQQLQFDDRGDGLREFGMPFDHLAADQ